MLKRFVFDAVQKSTSDYIQKWSSRVYPVFFGGIEQSGAQWKLLYLKGEEYHEYKILDKSQRGRCIDYSMEFSSIHVLNGME